MSAPLIGYVRVSSSDGSQRVDRQADALAGHGVPPENIHEERASAAQGSSRPVLDGLLAPTGLRAGDVLVVASLDRLARSLSDLLRIVDSLTSRGVTVRSLSPAQEFSGDRDDPAAKLTMQVLGACAEFERALIKKRQAEGIAAAKARGVKLGRRPSLSGRQVEEIRRRAADGVTATRLAKDFEVSRYTISQALEPGYVTREEWLAAAKR